jgi:hypothetical protein
LDTGKLRVELDLKIGTIRSVELNNTDRQNKRLVEENRQPLVFGTLLEAPGWDGVSDLAPGRMVTGRYSAGGFSVREDPGYLFCEGGGSLEFGNGDAIGFNLSIRFKQDSRLVQATLALSAKGRFRNRYIRQIGVALPLALNSRKRVIQAADQGLIWDTRHRYQFHARLWSFMSQPEHNWWRHFYVDQQSEHAYVIHRGENTDTAPLEVFRGRRAPGWMSMYDETGGVLFAYRGLAERAPKCLCANAEAGGEAIVYLHSPTHTAISPRGTLAGKTLFGAEHEIGLAFYDNLGAVNGPEGELARLWNLPAERVQGPRDRAGEEVGEWRASPARAAESPYVSGGMPLPRKAVTSPDQVRLFVRGRETVAQTRPLAFWPDGSLKWIEMVFPLQPGRSDRGTGSGEGDEVEFDVSLRNGRSSPCRLKFGKTVKQASRTGGIRLAENGDGVSIDTGRLKLAVGGGERWLRSAVLDGREMIRDDGQAQAYVDFLRPEGYVAATAHADGRADPGPVRIEKIEVQEAGPLRAVVRLEGTAQAEEAPKVILRLEVFAGRSFVRLHHTVEFTQKDPRKVFVRRMGLRLPLALSKSGLKMAAGGERGPVAIGRARRAGLRQCAPASYSVWSARDGLPEEVEGGRRSHGWLDLSGRQGGVAVMQRDMWQEFPNALLADSGDPSVSMEFWPASSPLMDVRRYSNYPHRAQGETAPEDPFWVRDVYYKNEPFVGISKTHEAMLFFHDAEASPERVDAVAADLNSRPLVYAGWDWYARTKITIPQVAPDSPKHGKFVANMRNVADWWMFHQRAWGWYGMWNYGDIQHLFHRGYGCVLMPESLERMLKVPVAERPDIDVRRTPWRTRQDYFTQHDWAFDNGRWGWTNTEGLLNLFMSGEYLRTGRRDVFFFMEALARHARDVDARHSGKWFGKGTRHGVQHWSCGDHEERQTTFTEQRIYYLLTGDRRTFEWNEELTEKWYLRQPVSYMPGHAGRSYGLLCRWEWTGDRELGDLLKKYLHHLAQKDGIAINPLVEFPSGNMVKAVSQKSDDRVFRPKGVFAAFFHNFGAMHTIIEYVQLTDDEKLKTAVIKTAEKHLAEPEQARYPYRKAIAFAALHARDPRPFKRALQEWATSAGWRAVYQQVAGNREHWTGPTAFFYGDTMGDKFWWADAHYVMNAFDAEPDLPAELEAERLFLENRPPVPWPRLPKESWQSEYDRPEFAEYNREPFET